MMNPFLVSGYHSPAYFCDREQETERLISCINNGRHCTLISLRRMGKSGLIQHTFRSLANRSDAVCLSLDIYPTENLHDLIGELAKTVFGALEPTRAKLLKSIGKHLKALRPTVKFDATAGQMQPLIEFNAGASEREQHATIEEIFQYLGKQKRTIVLAIDEVQQIAQYPETNVEALLRTHIQPLTNVRCIFSGSQKHTMTQMFTGYGRPFFGSTEILHLEPIAPEPYKAFIDHHFAAAGRHIDQSAIQRILDWTHGHTYYVQYVCNKLYSSGVEQIDVGIVDAQFRQILTEHETEYYSYRNLLTAYQWRLLRAIAKEHGVRSPKSQQFISRYRLGAASSVQTALQALLDKEIVIQHSSDEHTEYRAYNVFLEQWLALQGL